MSHNDNKILLTLDDSTKQQLDYAANLLRTSRLAVIRKCLKRDLEFLINEEGPKILQAREAEANRWTAWVRSLDCR